MFSYIHPYVLGYDRLFIEVWNIERGELVQIIIQDGMFGSNDKFAHVVSTDGACQKISRIALSV